jgi:hypothetical protein
MIIVDSYLAQKSLVLTQKNVWNILEDIFLLIKLIAKKVYTTGVKRHQSSERFREAIEKEFGFLKDSINSIECLRSSTQRRC